VAGGGSLGTSGFEPLCFANEDEEDEENHGKFMASLSYKNVPLISKTSQVDEYPHNQVGFKENEGFAKEAEEDEEEKLDKGHFMDKTQIQIMSLKRMRWLGTSGFEPLGITNEEEQQENGEDEKLDKWEVTGTFSYKNIPLIRKTSSVDEYPPNQVGFMGSIRVRWLGHADDFLSTGVSGVYRINRRKKEKKGGVYGLTDREGYKPTCMHVCKGMEPEEREETVGWK